MKKPRRSYLSSTESSLYHMMRRICWTQISARNFLNQVCKSLEQVKDASTVSRWVQTKSSNRENPKSLSRHITKYIVKAPVFRIHTWSSLTGHSLLWRFLTWKGGMRARTTSQTKKMSWRNRHTQWDIHKIILSHCNHKIWVISNDPQGISFILKLRIFVIFINHSIMFCFAYLRC